MRTRYWICGLLLLGAFVGVGSGILFRGPAYQGRALRAWLRDLDHPSALVRHNAQEAVSHLGTNAVPALREILHAEDSSLKTNIVFLLRRQRLVRITFVPARERRISAALACCVLESRAEPAIPDLFAFSLEDSYCRNLAESALGQMGTGAVARISRALTHEDLNIRRTAAGALHHIAAPGITPPDALVNCLNDRYGSVRSEAAYALGRMDASSATLNGMVKALDDVEPDVRVAAAVGLTGLGQRAVPALRERLKNSGPLTIERINKILQKIEDSEIGSAQ